MKEVRGAVFAGSSPPRGFRGGRAIYVADWKNCMNVLYQ